MTRTQEQRIARNEYMRQYMRQYRKDNPDKARQWRESYILRQAAKIQQERKGGDAT